MNNYKYWAGAQMPTGLTRLEVVAYVVTVMEAGMTCCVIGSPGQYRLVESLVGQRAVAGDRFGGQRSGETCLSTGGKARFYVNRKAFRSFEIRFGRLVQRNICPSVVISEDDDGIWEVCEYSHWLRRKMVKPPPVSRRNLLEDWL